jgi:hypothetical protein
VIVKFRADGHQIRVQENERPMDTDEVVAFCPDPIEVEALVGLLNLAVDITEHAAEKVGELVALAGKLDRKAAANPKVQVKK